MINDSLHSQLLSFFSEAPMDQATSILRPNNPLDNNHSYIDVDIPQTSVLFSYLNVLCPLQHALFHIHADERRIFLTNAINSFVGWSGDEWESLDWQTETAAIISDGCEELFLPPARCEPIERQVRQYDRYVRTDELWIMADFWLASVPGFVVWHGWGSTCSAVFSMKRPTPSGSWVLFAHMRSWRDVNGHCEACFPVLMRRDDKSMIHT